MQEKTVATSGGIYDIAIGYAYNKKDQLLIVGSLGVPIVSYDNTTTFRESDTSSHIADSFNYFNSTHHYSTTVSGVTLKFVLIHTHNTYIRLDLAIPPPTSIF